MSKPWIEFTDEGRIIVDLNKLWEHSRNSQSSSVTKFFTDMINNHECGCGVFERAACSCGYDKENLDATL